MKKLSFFANTLQTSVLSLALLVSACVIGFTSCSDDDDESNGGIVGTWQSVHIDTWEKINGEQTEDGSYSGPYEQGTVVFTAEGRISMTEEGESTETATYTFTGDKLIIKSDGETTEVKVLKLSDDKLILEYHESDRGYESYIKVEFRKVN